ncbi:zinc-binding dehydrogenase [Streptomyces sp. NPDC049881]|uniref:zinc-binding dehydrogenase n=1 Tax=Streptomyces sp. NPDC049881 TaxID=3155778 RepID=UPI0034417F00
MRALVLDRPGSPDTLRLADLPVPEAGPGQVRVRVEACGLNPVDYQIAGGGHPQWEWPHVLGLDVAGTVDAVGEGVTQVRVGQRVAFHGDLRRPGGFAEFAVADADVLAPLPDDLDAVTAAALPCAGMAAYQAVFRRLHVTAGRTVLVTGGAGGVGGFAVQLAAGVGARVIATSSAGNAAYVRQLGAHDVVDYQQQDVAARVRELTGGRGVDAVVDTVGPDSAAAHLGLLVHGGGLVAVSGRPERNTVAPFTTAPSLHEIALGSAYSHGDEQARADLAAMLGALFTMVTEKRLAPMTSRTVALEEVPSSLAELATRHARGKTVYAAG